jgi:hypothetical protein
VKKKLHPLEEYENYEDDVLKDYEAGFKEEEKKEDEKNSEEIEIKKPPIQEEEIKKVPIQEEKIFLRINNLKYDLKEEQVLSFFKKHLGERFKYHKILLNSSKGFGEIIVKSKEIADNLLTLNGKV